MKEEKKTKNLLHFWLPTETYYKKILGIWGIFP
jgi:hypothetical protein